MTWTTRQRSEFGALAAISSGEGAPLVLLHGVGLRAEAWNRQVDALLAEGHRIIAPDMPGHGGSPTVPIPRSLQGYTDPVAAGLDEPAIVVGHSMGAMIALDLAARYPDLVRGVVAMNAVFRRNPGARKAVEARVAALDGVHRADPTETLERWFGGAASPERSACELWLRSCDPSGYKAAYTVFAQEDGASSEALMALSVPALFLTGSEEPNSTPEMSRDMAALVPGGRSEVIRGAAHMMPMTHPRQVNRSLLGFVRECRP
ncbi:alpha/beta fold hydrolase [Primorskyibacter sp. S87]|uniref:alpha/beta fold hydrolase n=1 Tax=Primorskyibacter sp. S87 TaxID=3415126 RepID=UPI003C7A86BA